MQIDDEIEQEIIEDDNEYDSKDLPAYSELLVDSNIPHSLYDDYTYKRPAGFEFLGRKYSAKDWKDILVQTCERLAEKDIVLFSSFVDDKVMQGRKVKYFHTDIRKIRTLLRDFFIFLVLIILNMVLYLTTAIIKILLKRG